MASLNESEINKLADLVADKISDKICNNIEKMMNSEKFLNKLADKVFLKQKEVFKSEDASKLWRDFFMSILFPPSQTEQYKNMGKTFIESILGINMKSGISHFEEVYEDETPPRVKNEKRKDVLISKSINSSSKSINSKSSKSYEDKFQNDKDVGPSESSFIKYESTPVGKKSVKNRKISKIKTDFDDDDLIEENDILNFVQIKSTKSVNPNKSTKK